MYHQIRFKLEPTDNLKERADTNNLQENHRQQAESIPASMRNGTTDQSKIWANGGLSAIV